LKKLNPEFEEIDRKTEDQNLFWSSLDAKEDENHIRYGNSASFFSSVSTERSEELLNLLKKNGLSRDDKILELGSNCGRNINYIKSQGFPNVLGLEINQEAIDHGVEEYELLSEENFIQGSAESAIGRVGQIDWLFTMAVMIHLTEEQKISIYEWAKKNVSKGIVFVESFSKNTMHHYGLKGHWFSHMSKKEIPKIGKKTRYRKFKSIGYTACIITM